MPTIAPNARNEAIHPESLELIGPADSGVLSDRSNNKAGENQPTEHP